MRCACFDLQYRKRDILYWLYEALHPAFEQWPPVSANRYMDEIEYMNESGLTDAEYYGMGRGERAVRVAAMICRRAVMSMRDFDQSESRK